ncbi:MAG: phosphoribosyl-ATP diphosphatase [Oscillospiraceae bacterium]
MNNVLEGLSEVVLSRRENFEEGSYTCYLFSKGEDKILKKCGEECAEMIIAAKNNDADELKNEISDLLYHILVLCAEKNLPWSAVEEVLEQRRQKIGNLKQFHVTDKDS